MSDLRPAFAKAQQDVSALSQRPDNEMLLQLATQGDATGDQECL